MIGCLLGIIVLVAVPFPWNFVLLLLLWILEGDN